VSLADDRGRQSECSLLALVYGESAEIFAETAGEKQGTLYLLRKPAGAWEVPALLSGGGGRGRITDVSKASPLYTPLPAIRIP
jgi:hypothetical protein